jgi:hypothetical protein
MPQEQQRWDPSTPAFVDAVLRTMIGLGMIVSIVGSVIRPAAASGFISGGALAIMLYLVAMQAGRVFVRTQNYSRTMLWLALSQLILWVGMALLLAVAKVNPIGFVIGASILLVAILVTLLWYAVRKRRSQ